MFFTYSQNNSHGTFDYTDGLSVFVIVEAESADEANEKAEKIGIYFDDDYEIDCECCGQRWTKAIDGDPVLSTYGTKIPDVRTYERPLVVHFADGRVERSEAHDRKMKEIANAMD